MKLLILTQYFPPEIGAPQNRLFELAVRLQKSGVDVTVLTAMPNYPKMEVHPEYVGLKYHYEEMEGLKVHRSSIYVTKSKSIPKRLRNYFSFVWSSYKTGKRKLDESYDVLMCESPPLFLGMAAWRLAKRKNAKFIFNVSDLWPESAEKLGLVTNKLMLKMATRLEEKLYCKADLVTGQTQGICRDIQGRFPDKKVYWLPNGVDLSFYNPESGSDEWRVNQGFASDDVLFLYGGIIGHAQGLEVILNAASKVSNSKIKFLLLGSGPEKPMLLEMKESLKLTNVFFYDPVPKSEMPAIVNSIDVSLVPLKKLPLFLGAIPSKIFEALAMKNPILLGVDGEARDLFERDGDCAVYFEPESIEGLVEGAEQLAADSDLRKRLGENGRAYVGDKFNRNKLAEGFKSQLDQLII